MVQPPANEARARMRETELVGGVAFPAFLAIIYGTVQFFRHGGGLPLFAITYIPFLGGVASLVAILAYTHTIKEPEGRSWALTAGSLSVFIPYLFSLYLIAFLGAWAAFRAVTAHPLAWGHALVGGFWFLAGSRMLYVLGQI